MGNTSAYFNGDTVLVGLIAGPGAVNNRIEVAAVALEMVGDGSQPIGLDPCGICGADDRVPSDELWTGRLLPPGCTASVISIDSCLVSAGHCVTGGMVIPTPTSPRPATQPACYRNCAWGTSTPTAPSGSLTS